MFMPKIGGVTQDESLEFKVTLDGVNTKVRITNQHSKVCCLALSDGHVPGALEQVGRWHLVGALDAGLGDLAGGAAQLRGSGVDPRRLLSGRQNRRCVTLVGLSLYPTAEDEDGADSKAAATETFKEDNDPSIGILTRI